MKPDSNDTITAISSPPGEGGIGIVRLSGKNAIPIAGRIFKPKNNRKISRKNSFTVRYGHVHQNGTLIDEALLTRHC